MAITSILRNFDGQPNIVYIVTSDNLATITTAGYVTAQAANIELLNNGEFQWNAAGLDLVCIAYSPSLVNWFTYDATNATFVALPVTAGTLSQTLLNTHIFVGSAANIATDVAMSGDATIANTGAVTLANNAVTSAKTATNLIQYAEVAISAAEFNGMYAAPKLLVAAPGANKMIVVDKIVLNMTFVSAQYAAGGVVAAQYDSTVHGAGSAASATIAAATVNGYAASTGIMVAGALSSVAFTACVNKGLYLSNATAAFTTGDSTWKAEVWYRIVPTV
jgi:hypothetical protein